MPACPSRRSCWQHVLVVVLPALFVHCRVAVAVMLQSGEATTGHVAGSRREQARHLTRSVKAQHSNQIRREPPLPHEIEPEHGRGFTAGHRGFAQDIGYTVPTKQQIAAGEDPNLRWYGASEQSAGGGGGGGSIMPNEDGAPYVQPSEKSGGSSQNSTSTQKKKNVTLTVGPPGANGMREILPDTRKTIQEETETYEKVVKESERQSGLNDTVDTTTTVAEDDTTEESEQENYVDAVCIVGVLVLICVMAFTHRKQQKAVERHEEEHNDAPITSAATAAAVGAVLG